MNNIYLVIVVDIPGIYHPYDHLCHMTGIYHENLYGKFPYQSRYCFDFKVVIYQVKSGIYLVYDMSNSYVTCKEISHKNVFMVYASHMT